MTVIRLDGGLRLQTYDPNKEELELHEEEFIWLMNQYPADTNLRHGDIVYALSTPPDLRQAYVFQEHGIPQFWKIQFVTSEWQRSLRTVMRTFEVDADLAARHLAGDQSLGLPGELEPSRRTRAYAYVHGFPHGNNPNTAWWFPCSQLKKLSLRTLDVDWYPVLDEFKTPFYGYEEEETGSGLVLDMAPDMYAEGIALNGPMSHEEGAFHTASLMGLEEQMMVNREVDRPHGYMDLDHDAFDLEE